MFDGNNSVGLVFSPEMGLVLSADDAAEQICYRDNTCSDPTRNPDDPDSYAPVSRKGRVQSSAGRMGWGHRPSRKNFHFSKEVVSRQNEISNLGSVRMRAGIQQARMKQFIVGVRDIQRNIDVKLSRLGNGQNEFRQDCKNVFLHRS